MPRFIITYEAPVEAAMEKMQNATPEEKAEGMKPWMVWMESCGSALIDGGAPLIPQGNLTKSGWGHPKTTTTGYSILEAENINEAKKLLEGHPHLDWIDGCEINIYEAMAMEMA